MLTMQVLLGVCVCVCAKRRKAKQYRGLSALRCKRREPQRSSFARRPQLLLLLGVSTFPPWMTQSRLHHPKRMLAGTPAAKLLSQSISESPWPYVLVHARGFVASIGPEQVLATIGMACPSEFSCPTAVGLIHLAQRCNIKQANRSGTCRPLAALPSSPT